MDFFSLIEELIEIREDSILNKEQTRRFFETTMFDYLSKLEADDLPALKAAIRMAKE